MKTLKYIVNFIQNGYISEDSIGKYANAIIFATSKEEAAKQAKLRAHFGELISVTAAHNHDLIKVKTLMIKKFGNHKGIA